MDNQVDHTKIDKAIWFAIGLFLVIFILLSFYDRFAQDDFYFLSNARDLGIWKGMIHEYESYNSRWSGMLFLHAVMAFFLEFPILLPLFPLLSLAAFIYAVHRVLKALGAYAKQDLKEHWKITLYLTGILFFGTLGHGETWFWISSMCMYLWGNMAWILGLSWILEKGNSWISWAFATLLWIFFGASSEPLVILVGIGLFLLLIYTWKHRKVGAEFYKSRVIRIGFALVCIAISFAILSQGGGIEKRRMHFEEISFLSSFLLNFKITAIILWKKILIPFLIMTGALIPLIHPMRKYYSKRLLELPLLSPMLILLTIIFFYQWPVTHVTQDIMADRGLFFLTIIGAICILWQLILVQEKWEPISERSFLIPASLLLMITLMICLGGLNVLTSMAYTQSYDERMRTLDEVCTDSQTIVLEPLARSGWIPSAEISTDSSHFSNQHLKKFMESSSDIRTKEPEKSR